MREIKYRAWDEKKKQMYYSDKKADPPGIDDNVFCVFADGTWKLGEINYDWSITDNGTTNDGGILMQFTGLKDYKGNEVYEGDILEYSHYGEIIRVPVTFSNGSFGWTGERTGIPYSFIVEPLLHNFHVCGNIYESPKLLK